MRKKLLIAFCFVVSLFSFLSCEPETYDTRCTLTVYVYSKALPPDGEPIDRALVTITPGTANNFTGTDGIVVFEDLVVSGEQFTIQAQKEGYSTNRVHLSLRPGREETAYITLVPNN